MSEPIPTQGTVKRCGNCGTAYLPSRVHKHDCVQSLQSQLDSKEYLLAAYKEDEEKLINQIVSLTADLDDANTEKEVLVDILELVQEALKEGLGVGRIYDIAGRGLVLKPTKGKS